MECVLIDLPINDKHSFSIEKNDLIVYSGYQIKMSYAINTIEN